jgi:OTU domain-containing protein 3
MIKDVAGDGNCLFRAIADQLENAPTKHEQYRAAIMKFVEENRDMFEPFVEDDVPFPDYVAKMKTNGNWGGNIEIQATSLLYSVNVIIHQLDQPRWEIINFEDPKTRAIHLSYHDGDHYASVRAINGDLPPAVSPISTSKTAHTTTTNNSELPPNAFETSVMQASGCEDIKQVRQALEDNEYDFDATVAFLMMIRETAADANVENIHIEEHSGIHEVAHHVHEKISKILHHHDHGEHNHHLHRHGKQKGNKANKQKQQQQQQPAELARDLGALCI